MTNQTDTSKLHWWQRVVMSMFRVFGEHPLYRQNVNQCLRHEWCGSDYLKERRDDQ